MQQPQNHDNPFRQAERLFLITVHAEKAQVAAVEEMLEDMSLAILSFEVDEAAALWKVDIITGWANPLEAARERLAVLGEEAFAPQCQPIEAKDWVSEVQKSFAPIHAGRFYVHGSHVSTVPHGAWPIQLDAGAAFGSGEHATTKGCLLVLNMLAKIRHRPVRRVLDMGCGSGILAIAMARAWGAELSALAVDIDPVSVRVAAENVTRNRVRRQVRTLAGNGYYTREVQGLPLCDVIVANILARPLTRMARQLKRRLKPGGVVVLSGLLARQERDVLHAHRLQGLYLKSRIQLEGWNTLVLG